MRYRWRHIWVVCASSIQYIHIIWQIKFHQSFHNHEYVYKLQIYHITNGHHPQHCFIKLVCAERLKHLAVVSLEVVMNSEITLWNMFLCSLQLLPHLTGAYEFTHVSVYLFWFPPFDTAVHAGLNDIHHHIILNISAAQHPFTLSWTRIRNSLFHEKTFHISG